MNETFIINSGQWPQDSDKYVTTIVKDGKYTIDNKIDVIFYSKPVRINEDQDFSISISAVHKNGSVDEVYGICFGLDNTDNNYQFGITANGKFVVSRSDEGVFRDLISFVPSAAIKKEENAVNILTIRQEENNWRFYINDQWVASSPKLDFFNKRAGFYVEGKQKIDFDDLIIKQLEVTKIYKTKLCLIEKGVLKEIDVEQTQDNHITAVINGTTQGFWKNSPPDILGYAAAQPWYINNEPVTFKGFNFSKYGNVKSISMAELKKAGEYKSVGIYLEAGKSAIDSSTVLYIPVRIGCQWQPYTIQCPSIELNVPRYGNIEDTITFTATISGVKDPKFNWIVSEGKILKGQGTRSIQVSTVGLMRSDMDVNLIFTPKSPGCENSKSVMIHLVNKPTGNGRPPRQRTN